MSGDACTFCRLSPGAYPRRERPCCLDSRCVPGFSGTQSDHSKAPHRFVLRSNGRGAFRANGVGGASQGSCGHGVRTGRLQHWHQRWPSRWADSPTLAHSPHSSIQGRSTRSTGWGTVVVSSQGELLEQPRVSLAVPPPSAEAQLAFLAKLQRLFSEGDFTATYKFALLIALADLAVELGADDGAEALLLVQQARSAERFVHLYWRHAMPYGTGRAGSQPRPALVQNIGAQLRS